MRYSEKLYLLDKLTFIQERLKDLVDDAYAVDHTNLALLIQDALDRCQEHLDDLAYEEAV
jgi:hypothetical protein